MKIELILVGVIVIVFLVDFIMNSINKPSIDNLVNQIEGGAPVETNSTLNYILDRKKNVVLFLIIGLINKVSIHYFLFPKHPNSGKFVKTLNGKYRVRDSYYTFSETVQAVFTDELLLFIPAFISLILVVWIFNDKIKAR
jgi:hypothetical protein